MSEPVSLDSEQLLLLIKRAEATGYMKAINALYESEYLRDNFNGITITKSCDWLESKKEEILK